MRYWSEAKYLLEHNKIKETIEMAQKCIEADPQIQDEFIGLGCLQDRIGYHYGTAFEWYCKMREQYHSISSPYDILSLSISVDKEDCFSSYLNWYNERLEVTPNNFKLWYSLATLYYNHKKFTEAEQAYKTVIKYNPNFQQAYLKIAFIYCFKLNRDSEAVEWAKKAKSMNESDYFASLVISLCHKDIP